MISSSLSIYLSIELLLVALIIRWWHSLQDPRRVPSKGYFPEKGALTFSGHYSDLVLTREGKDATFPTKFNKRVHPFSGYYLDLTFTREGKDATFPTKCNKSVLPFSAYYSKPIAASFRRTFCSKVRVQFWPAKSRPSSFKARCALLVPGRNRAI